MISPAAVSGGPRRLRIGVGIPCFQTIQPDVAFDYMRMWYSFGKRYPDYDFFLIQKTKSEQFRARNSIVQTGLQFGLDYLFFLDDDHIFDWQGRPDGEAYNFLHTLIDHQKDIVGCLYYHRTGEYRPVLMKKYGEKGYTFMSDADITGGLQEVDVQGGGCMLINMKIFDRLKPPYFEPEMMTDGNSYGTDIQLCRKAQEAGFSVWCDTSIVVGHLKQEAEIIHSENRDNHIADTAMRGGFAEEYMMANYLKAYRKAVVDHTGFEWDEVVEHAMQYNDLEMSRFEDFEDKRDYYRQLGVAQLCRQAHFHSSPLMSQQGLVILKQFKKGFKGRGVDFGCGSAPVGFELVKAGHDMDFIDLDGAAAYEFLKWRVKDEGYEDRAGYELTGPYDFALMLDSIEHIEDWQGALDQVCGRLKEKGVLITNYFLNRDFHNPEHISMDHAAVADFLGTLNMVPKSSQIWIKDDAFMQGIHRG